MKKVLPLLPWIVAALALAAVWTLGWLARWPLASRAWWSLGIVVAVVLVVVALRLLKRAPTGSVDGAARAAIKVLESQWYEALAALRRAHPGADRAQPWYLVIGPPGAGKSTLLADSGIGLAPIAGAGAGDQKPTLCFAWWRSDAGLFIDTAGRYASDPRSRAEWRALLGLIRSARRGTLALQGVIACVPVGDLIKKGDAAMAAEAQNVRERLDELTAELGVAPPFYTVFTKADGIGGFKDFFADARRADKEQALGWTHAWSGGEPGPMLTDQHRRIVAALQARRLGVLARAASDEARRKLFQFPVQLNAAWRFVGDFLVALTRPSALRESARFRGFYYTSCLHQLSTSGSAAPAAATSPAAAPAPAPKPSLDASVFLTATAVGISATQISAAVDARLGCFVRNLLEKVVIADRALARPTRRAQTRARAWRLACLAGAPAAALIACLWLAFDAGRAARLADGARVPAQLALDAERAAARDAARNLKALDDLGQQLDRLIARDDRRLAAVTSGAGQVYTRRLRALLLDPALDRVRADLDRLRAGAGVASTDRDELTDLYRTYRMLGGSLRVQPEVITRTLRDERRWFTGIEAAGAADYESETRADRQLTLLAQRLVPAVVRVEIDERLVDALTKELGESLWVMMGYDDALRSLDGQFGTLRSDAVAGGVARDLIAAEAGFSAAFTQQGWDDAVERALGEKAERVGATLTEMSIAHDVAAIRRRLVERFVADHQKHWLRLLASTRVNGLADFSQVPDAILRLTGPDSPYPAFASAALEQCALKTSFSLFGGGENTAWIAPALSAIGELRKDVQQFLAATEAGRRSEDPKRVKDLADRFNAIAARCGEALAPVQPTERRAALQKGLDTLLRSLWQPLDREMAAEQDRRWKDVAVRGFAGARGRFPFADVAEEVSTADFARMFNPVSGWLWGALKPIEDLRAIPVIGAPALTLGEPYLATVARAQQIRSIFFAASSETVNAPFTIQFMQRGGIEDMAFSIGNQTYRFYDRPDARYQAFLRQTEPAAAKLSVRIAGQWKSADGGGSQWALLRLLRGGDPKVMQKGEYLFTWTIEGRSATGTAEYKACLQLEPNGLEKAAVQDLLTGFAVPETIALTTPEATP